MPVAPINKAPADPVPNLVPTALAACDIVVSPKPERFFKPLPALLISVAKFDGIEDKLGI